MEPLLEDGDIAFVCEEAIYNVGDIVIFNYSQNNVNTLISHRIVYKNRDLYYCKGDNSLNLEIITRSSIIGKIISVERNGRKLQLKIDRKVLNDFCVLSLNCGEKWESGDRMLAKQLAKRCYVNMCKIKSSM